MIYLERGLFCLRAKRSDALHSRWTNLAAGVVGFFGCFPHQELIGDIGWFHHEYNIRTYVENNTTQEHSTRNSSLIKSDRVAIALSVRLSDLVPKQLTTATLENALHEAVCASRHATVILSLQHSTTHLLLSSIEHSN